MIFAQLESEQYAILPAHGWRALHSPPLAGWTRRSPCWQVSMCSIRMASTCRWWITASAAIMNLILTTLHRLPVPSSSWKQAIGWPPSWSMWVQEQPETSWAGFSSWFTKIIVKNTVRPSLALSTADFWNDWLIIYSQRLIDYMQKTQAVSHEKNAFSPPTAQLCRGGGLHSFHLRQLQCSRHEGKRWRGAKLSCFFPHINFPSGSVKRSDWIFHNSAATVEWSLTGG